jgi:hydrogenase nickel incorporation protein HypA/HybF
LLENQSADNLGNCVHELSIALSIVDAVEAEAQRRGLGDIAAVHIRLGPLSGVISEALSSAWEMAREGSSLKNSRLVIQDVPIIMRCPKCQADRELPSAQWMCCPVCNTPATEVISGREMDIMALEVSGDEHDNGSQSDPPNGPAAPAGGSPPEDPEAK